MSDSTPAFSGVFFFFQSTAGHPGPPTAAVLQTTQGCQTLQGQPMLIHRGYLSMYRWQRNRNCKSASCRKMQRA